MNSPPTNNDRDPQPAKTPGGWARALGIFTTAKKKPNHESVVDSSTDHTGATNNFFAVANNPSHNSGHRIGGLFSNTGDSSPGLDEFQSPLAEDPSGRQLRNSSNGSIGSSARKTKMPRMELSMLPTHPMNDSNAMDTSTDEEKKMPTENQPVSPWHNANAHHATFSIGTKSAMVASPWHGPSRRTRAGGLTNASTATVTAGTNPMAAIVSATRTSAARTRRYRPNSALLVGSRPIGRRYRLTAGGRADFNPQGFSQALNNLKESFLPSLPNEQSKVLSVPGRVHFGSCQFPTRLPKPGQSQKRQRVDTHENQDDGDSDDQQGIRKRRKTVSWQQHDAVGESPAVVQRIAATPAAKPKAYRRGTPFPTSVPPVEESPSENSGAARGRNNDVANFGSPPSSTSSSQRTPAFPDKPRGAKYNPDGIFVFQAPVSERGDVSSPRPGECPFQWNVAGTAITSNEASTFKGVKDWEASTFVEPEMKETPEPTGAKRPRSDDDDDEGTYDDDEDDDDKPSAKKKKSHLAGSSKVDEVIPDWICSACQTANDSWESACSKCGARRTLNPEDVGKGWGDMFALKPGQWKCEACLSLNEDEKEDVVCKSCEVPNPKANPTVIPSAPDSAPPVGAGPSPAVASKSTVSTWAGTGAHSHGTTSSASIGSGGFTYSTNALRTTSSASIGIGPGGFRFAAPDAGATQVAGVTPPTKPAASLVPGTQNGGAGSLFGGGASTGIMSGAQDGVTFPPVPPAAANDGSKTPSTFSAQTSTFSAANAGSRPVENGLPGNSLGSSASASAASKPTGENGDKGTLSAFGGTTSTGEKTEETGVPAYGNFGLSAGIAAGDGSSISKTPPASFGSSAMGSTSFLAAKTDPVKPGQMDGVHVQPPPFNFGQNRGAPLVFGGTPAPPSVAHTVSTTLGSMPPLGTAQSDAVGGSGSSNAALFGAAPAAPTPSGGSLFGSASFGPTGPVNATPANTAAAPAPMGRTIFGQTSSSGAPGGVFGLAAAAYGPTQAPASNFPSVGTPAIVPATSGYGAAPNFGQPSTQTSSTTGFGATPGTTFGATPGAAMTFGSPAPAPPTSFGATPQTTAGFGTQPGTSQVSGFGAATAGATSNFNSASFGNGAPLAGQPFGSFAGMQAGGFPGSQTPALSSTFGGGGGFGATAPNTAPAGGDGLFSIGSSGPKTPGRRKIKAKRPR